MTNWIEACGTDDIQPDEVIAFNHGHNTYAIYRTDDGEFFATDGLCTHERADLADGLLLGNIIECPLHNGQFDITTGKALSGPVCVDLKTYPLKIEKGRVFIGLS